MTPRPVATGGCGRWGAGGCPRGGQVGRIRAVWGRMLVALLSAKSRIPWRPNRSRSNGRLPTRSPMATGLRECHPNQGRVVRL